MIDRYYLAGIFSLAFSLVSSVAVGSEKPNIIFIFADDVGVGDVSHNGGKAVTPHIDRLPTLMDAEVIELVARLVEIGSGETLAFSKKSRMQSLLPPKAKLFSFSFAE